MYQGAWAQNEKAPWCQWRWLKMTWCTQAEKEEEKWKQRLVWVPPGKKKNLKTIPPFDLSPVSGSYLTFEVIRRGRAVVRGKPWKTHTCTLAKTYKETKTHQSGTHCYISDLHDLKIYGHCGLSTILSPFSCCRSPESELTMWVAPTPGSCPVFPQWAVHTSTLECTKVRVCDLVTRCWTSFIFKNICSFYTGSASLQ